MFEGLKNKIHTIQNGNQRTRGIIVLLVTVGIFIFIVSIWLGFFYAPPSIQRESRNEDTNTSTMGDDTKQAWEEIKKGMEMISSTTQKLKSIGNTSTTQTYTSTTTATSSN